MHESRLISREMAMKAASALKIKSTEIRAALKSPKKREKPGKSENQSEPETAKKTGETVKKDLKMDLKDWAGSKGENIPVCVKCEEEGGNQCTGPCMLFYHDECSGVKNSEETSER